MADYADMMEEIPLHAIDPAHAGAVCVPQRVRDIGAYARRKGKTRQAWWDTDP